ncbi:DSD1 family PLP-dependent enzyme [Rhodoferax sp.]|uniref:DSD1 family PLP-dependent enzyme n=1 Tax=Rhodoferax sp. TaxID=50421 RepID=UPI00374D7707
MPVQTLPGQPGQSVQAIDTPALVLDLDAMERNIARMAAFARQHGVLWRPHAKMHKSAALALQLVHAGAIGACVQKTSEAEALLAGGVRNIYISNQVIALSKLQRVAQIAAALAAEKPYGQLALAVDSLEGVQRLGRAAATGLRGSDAVIDVFVEIDVGQGRCGVAPGVAAVALAQAIAVFAHLRFAGLQAYHGKAQHLREPAQRRDAIAEALAAVALTRAALAEAGIAVPLVTGAGTGTMAHEAASGVYGELQSGSFLFMDADYASNTADPAQPVFEHALFVKTQVISTSAGHVVCDAGHKSHAIDSGLPKVHSTGLAAALDYFNGGDEHGILRSTEPGAALPELGQTLWLIPGHCDPTVNLHDSIVGVRGGLANGQVERLIRVDGRGALT